MSNYGLKDAQRLDENKPSTLAEEAAEVGSIFLIACATLFVNAIAPIKGTKLILGASKRKPKFPEKILPRVVYKLRFGYDVTCTTLLTFCHTYATNKLPSITTSVTEISIGTKRSLSGACCLVILLLVL